MTDEQRVQDAYKRWKSERGYAVEKAFADAVEGEAPTHMNSCAYGFCGGYHSRDEEVGRLRAENLKLRALTEPAASVDGAEREEKRLTIDEAEAQGKLGSFYAQDARNLGYSSYDSYLDEECK